MKKDLKTILDLIEKIVQTAKIVLDDKKPKKGDKSNVKRT